MTPVPLLTTDSPGGEGVRRADFGDKQQGNLHPEIETCILDRVEMALPLEELEMFEQMLNAESSCV